MFIVNNNWSRLMDDLKESLKSSVLINVSQESVTRYSVNGQLMDERETGMMCILHAHGVQL